MRSKRIAICSLLAALFIMLYSSSVYARTRIKTVEYALGSYYSSFSLTAGSLWSPASITVYFPEAPVTVRNAFLQYEATGIDQQDVGTFQAYFDQGTSATTQRFLSSGANTYSTDEHVKIYGKFDVTPAMNGSLSSASYAAAVRVNGANICAMTMKLFVTYEYDDTDTLQVKTVRFPVYSDWANKVAAKTAEAGEADHVFTYRADTEDLGTLRAQWFEISGLVQNQAGKFARDGTLVNLQVTGGSASSQMEVEQGDLSGSAFTYIDHAGGGASSGFSANTQQTVTVTLERADKWGTLRTEALGGECMLTYEYSDMASTKTKSISHFLGQDTDGGSAAFSKIIHIKEKVLQIKEVYAKIYGSYSSATGANIAVDSSVSGNSVPRASYYITAISPLSSGFTIVHSLSAQKDAWNVSSDTGTAVTLSIGSLSSLGGCSAELIVTYDYTDDAAYTDHYITHAGQSASGSGTSYDLDFDMWFPFPAAGTSTLRSAWLKLDFVQGPDQSGDSVTSSDPNTTTSLNSSSGQTVYHKTQNETWGQSLLYENQGQVVLASTSATANYSLSTNKAVFSGMFNAVYDHVPAPYKPYGLVQYESDGLTVIPAGGWIKDDSVNLVQISSSPLWADSISSELELRTSDTGFSGIFSSSLTAVAYSSTAIISTYTLSGLTGDTTYHWQVRSIGKGGGSDWQYFPEGASDSDFDFGIDLSSPSIQNNQAGYDKWQSLPGKTYDVDFQDNLSKLDVVQYAIYPDGYRSGAALKTWTNIADIDQADYTADWQVDFSTCQQGTNYVSVRAYDNVGYYKVSDVFYVKKDTSAPEITNNMAGGDSNWRKADPGAVYDVDFTDNYSYLDTAQYIVYSTAFMGGSIVKGWTDIFTSTDVSSYNDNFPIDFSTLIGGSNYVSIRCWDNAGSTSTIDAFFIKKDTITPAYVNNEFGGDNTWRRVNNGTYDVDFTDSNGGLLKDVQYRLVSGTGALVSDWNTYAADISSDSYTDDFMIPSSTFALLATSFTYVSVRAYDYAGNTTTITNAFYIKKDTIAPTYSNGELGGDAEWIKTARSYDVDFFDSISGLTGASYKAEADSVEVIALTPIPGVGGSSFTAPWNVDFNNLKNGATNYISIEIYDIAGNTTTINNAFFVKKDTAPPSFDNQQAGDDKWRRSNSGSYKVYFSDIGGSKLDKFTLKVTTGPNHTGTLITDWTASGVDISSITSYGTEWKIPDTVFDDMQPGINYVYLKLYDIAGSTSGLDNAFYVMKDTVAPSFTNNMSGGDDNWRKEDKGAIYQIDFSDDLSNLDTAQYTVYTQVGKGGGLVMDWTDIFTSTDVASYTDSFSVSFSSLSEGSNYVSIRFWDMAGSTETIDDAFYIKKDTTAPSYTNNESAGDLAWRKSNTGVYDIDYTDSGGSLLKDAEYKVVSATGAVIVDWYKYASAINSDSYNTDFTVPDSTFTVLATSYTYVSLRVYDIAGNTTTISDAFFIRKDTVAPVITVNQPYYGPPGSPVTQVDVDFSDSISVLDYAQYSINDAPGASGAMIKNWTSIFTSTNVPNYDQGWTVDFGAMLNTPATNWFSVRVADNAGNISVSTDAFRMFKSTPTPLVTDGQADVDTWVTAAGTAYDVDFSSKGGVNLDRFLTKLCSEPQEGGTVYEDWAVIEAGIGSGLYTDDWQIHFSSAGEGINYVSVWVYDTDGHNTKVQDVFYIRKDTSPPVIANNESGGDNEWRSSNTEYYDVNFTDVSEGSMLTDAEYKIESSTGGIIVDWYAFAAGIYSDSYTADWKIENSHFDLLPSNTNYVSVRISNEAGLSTAALNAFYILKDTAAPVITNNVTGDDTWQVSSGTIYDIEYDDPAGKLDYAQYRIVSATGYVVTDWFTYASAINSDTYNDLVLSAVHFDKLPSSTHSYVSVRVYDYALHMSSAADAFYIKKDTSAPVIANNESGGDPVWRNSSIQYDIDFTDDVSKMQKTQYTVYLTTGMQSGMRIDWTDIVSSTEAVQLDSDWELDFAQLKEGVTNYVSVRGLNHAGSTATIVDAFYVLKDTSTPVITDLQSGATTWRKVNEAFYDINFTDTGNSGLSYMAVKIYGAPYPSDLISFDWEVQISSINSADYSNDWKVSALTWNTLQNGKNYITVGVWDNAGNSTMTVDAFYILKDTVAPVITNGVTGDFTWHRSSGTLYNVDFSDQGSWIENARYTVYPATGMQGAPVLGWQDIISSTVTLYDTDWGVDFESLIPGYNYVTVQAYDHVAQTTTIVDAFEIRKDTSPPYINNNQSGDDKWRRINNGYYNLEFYDIGYSSLSYFQTRASTVSAGGNYLYGWENDLESIGQGSYTDAWQLTAAHWDDLMHGVTNYISVRVADLAGNTSWWSNAFYILKDTSAPVIDDNQSGDDQWRNVNSGTYDIDYDNAGGSNIDHADYKVASSTGYITTDWYTYAFSIDKSTYGADFQLENSHFDDVRSSFSYISVRVVDAAGSTTTLNNAFYVKKDTVSPVITDDETGDDIWRSSYTASMKYDVNFEDALSGLDFAQYRIKTSTGGIRIDWKTPASLSSFSTNTYTQDWQVEEGDFNKLISDSTSYVDVRVYDSAGSTDTEISAFYIKKDTVAPDAIDDLTGVPAAEGEVELTWTATGDNGSLGYIDNALYEIIYTDDDAALWDDPFNYSKEISTDTAAGGNETHTVTGLTASATYYFWIRIRDKAYNWSGVSNSTQSLAGADVTAPGRITDLNAQPGGFQGQVDLTWTAPGDSDYAGTPDNYVIRYQTYTPFNWNNAAEYSSSPDPAEAGSQQDFTVIGLDYNTTYWFGIRAYDEVPNESVLSSTASAVPAAPGERDGMLVSGFSTSDIPKVRVFSAGSWSDGTAGQSAASTIRWSVMRSNNIQKDEKMAGYLSGNNSLYIQRYNGSDDTWSSEFSVSAGISAYRCFDMAYEQNSGRCVVVYYKGTAGQVSYRVWSSTAAVWVKSETGLNITGLTGAMNWVRLEPRAGTDELMLVVLDSNDDIYAYRWNGSAFVNGQSITTIATYNTYECFDVAWESLSGECMVAFGEVGSPANKSPLRYKMWDTSSWGAAGSIIAGATFGNRAAWVSLASDPASDKIGFTSVDSGSDWNAGIWDGASWSYTGEDSGITGYITRLADCAWEKDSEKFIVIGADAADRIDWAYWQSGTWYNASGSISDLDSATQDAYDFGINIKWLRLSSDPNVNKMILTVVEDGDSVRTLNWSGSAWSQGTLQSNNSSDYNYECAFFAPDRHDNLPPVTADAQSGDLTWRNTNNGYYNVNFTDSGGSRLAYYQTRILDSSNSELQGWTTAGSGLNTDDYSTDWQLLNSSFDSMLAGQNKVYVRVYDGVGNVDNVNGTYVFDVYKDTSAPGITNSVPGDFTWRNSTGVVYNADFSDSYSRLDDLDYAVYPAPGLAGAAIKNWTPVFTDLDLTDYTIDWGVDFYLLVPGTANYVSARVSDRVGNIVTYEDIFVVYKDTVAPDAVIDLSASGGQTYGQVKLTWTSPADNSGFDDNTGGSYLVRYSTVGQVASQGEWDNATQYVQSWTPGEKGIVEEYYVLGLDPGTTYWFAVRVRDRVADRGSYNTSGLSNPSAGIRPQEGSLFINEVYAAGGAGNDWLELYNNTDAAIDTAGWYMYYYNGASTSTVWTGGAVVASGTFLSVGSLSLDNTVSCSVTLFDSSDGLISKVRYPVFSDDASFSRIYDGDTYFHIDISPTEGYFNSISTHPVKINEVLYSGDEFIELYNTQSSTLTLSGMKLINKNRSPFEFTRKIYPGNYNAIVHTSQDDTAKTYTAAFGASGLDTVSDYLILENGAGQTVDFVAWEGAAMILYSGNGDLVTYTNDAPSGAPGSIGRSVIDGSDTDVDSADFAQFTTASPGARNNPGTSPPDNTLSYPVSDTVLPRNFKLEMQLGADSSSGTNDTVWFVRISGGADGDSPHIYRLDDLGVDLSTTSVQSPVMTGVSEADIDGHFLSTGTVYRMYLNSDNSLGSAGQVIIDDLLYDTSLHSAAVSAITPSFATVNAGDIAGLFRLDITNDSEAGSNDIEIESVYVRFTDKDSNDFSTADTKNMFDEAYVVYNSTDHTNSIMMQPNMDIIVGTLPKSSFTVVSGRLQVPVDSPGSISTVISPQENGTYFIAVKMSTSSFAYSKSTFSVSIDADVDVKVREYTSDVVQDIAAVSSVSCGQLTTIEPAEVEWQITTLNSSPVFADSLIYGQKIYTGSDDGRFIAYDSSGTLKWSFDASGKIRAPLSGILDGSDYFIYFSDDANKIYKLRDDGSGYTKMWDRIMTSGISYIREWNGSIYASGADGNMFKLSPVTGIEIPGWDGALSGSLQGSPAIQDNWRGVNALWVSSNNGNVYRLQLGDGTVTSSLVTGGSYCLPPRLDTGYYNQDLETNFIFVASDDGKIYCRTAGNLATVPDGWKSRPGQSDGEYDTGSPLRGGVWRSIETSVKYIYTGNDAGQLYKITLSSGTLHPSWDPPFQAEGMIRITPVVIGSWMYFGDMSGYFYAVNIDDPDDMRTGFPVRTGSPIISGPVYDFNTKRLYIGTEDGRIYGVYIGP